MRRDVTESGRNGSRSAKSRLSAVFTGSVLHRRGSCKNVSANSRASSVNHSPSGRFRRGPSSITSDRMSDEAWPLSPNASHTAHSLQLHGAGHDSPGVGIRSGGAGIAGSDAEADRTPLSPRLCGGGRDSMAAADRMATGGGPTPKQKSISEELSDATYLSAVKLKDESVGVKPGRYARGRTAHANPRMLP